MSTVDVVVPCYNYARFLPGCVNSILTQKDVDVRVLVIDDASSDQTAIVGRELANLSPKVEYRQHMANRGHILTYNEGLLEWSAAEYTVLLSADDMLAPGSLSRAVQVMQADKNIGMVYGSTIHFEHNEELPRISSQTFTYNRWSGEEWIKGRCRAAHNVITSPEVVVRGSVQRSVGGYRAELPHAGDLEMWLRIAAVSDIAYIQRVPQAFYRVHANSMMRTVYKGSLIDLCQRKDVFDAFFQNHSTIIYDAEMLHEEANCALAREALWDACRAYDRNEVELANAKALEQFALNAYTKAACLPEFAALRRRERLGPGVCSRTQVFAVPALARRMRRWAMKQQWKREGI